MATRPVAYVYATRADVLTHRWVRRFDSALCEYDTAAYRHVEMLRAHGYPEAMWNDRQEGTPVPSRSRWQTTR